MATQRVLSLEVFRGLAALVVLVYHFMLAFWPAGIFILPGTPVYIVFNGNAAVAFFFVLSGFVNCRALFKDSSVTSLIRTLIRRWPRLMLPALLASLFAWLLYALGLYFNEAAGALSGSKWLADFANAGHAAGFRPSLVDAVVQGAVTVFITQHSDYVPPLWTMHFELLGSILVLVLAFVMARLSFGLSLGLAFVAAVVVASFPPHYGLPFTIGLILSYALLRLGAKADGLSERALAGLLLVSVYVFSYDKPVGIHAWIPQIDDWFWMEVQRIAIQSIGAAGIMFVGLKWQRLADCLSGKWAAWMGEMALPVFLIHAPVYCSLASWVLITAEPVFGYRVAAGLALVSGVAGTLPVAWGLARIDRLWAPLVNRGADWVVATLRA